MTRSGRTPIYGPEPWRTVRKVVWSHWYLWFCVVTVANHDGDLGALAAAIEDGGRSSGSGTTEAKLSHLDDLTRRLAEAGIDRRDAPPAAPASVRAGTTRPPAAVCRLTRAVLRAAGERARRRVPVKRPDVSARAPNRGRALLTFCYRAMERCDDSYGLIGELAQEALFNYARLAFAPAGIAAEDWCEDLCELLIWEDWGLLHRHETKPFAQLNGPLADHAERFLLALSDELRGHRLRHQADQALENVAYLHIAAGRLTSFAPAAAKLGSDRWMPIVALAQAAITRGRPDIARAVFAAADQPGLQRDYLHERCTELTRPPPTATSA